MRSRLSCYVLSMAALAGCGGHGAGRPQPDEPAAQGASQGPAVLAPCKDAPELRCGTIEVLEDRDKPEGRRIGINVVVAPALSKTPRPDPLFYFAGGPGDGATGNAADVASSFKAIRQERDIVFVDQRGAGESHRLDCDVPGSPENPRGYFEDFFNDELVRRCRETLSSKADLTRYTTSIAMDDVDEVRARLGYDRINLLGGSYGTRAAQVYMRRHTEHVRSAVLQGTVGMKQHLPLNHARDAQASMDGLLAACAADAACKKAFPRVRQELDAVIARLDKQPGTATVKDPRTGASVEVSITRHVFAENLRFSTYTPAVAMAAPLLIHRAHAGDFTPFARITLATEPSLRNALAWGMHLSVTCAEDVPFFPADIEPVVAGTYLGDYRVRMQQQACALWPRGEIPADFHEPVPVDVPTLLVSGALDPVTPPRWAEEAQKHLPHSLHVVLPDGHHGFWGLANIDCIDGIVTKFLESGTVEGLDTTCTATMKRPKFVTDGAELDALLAMIEGGPASEEAGQASQAGDTPEGKDARER